MYINVLWRLFVHPLVCLTVCLSVRRSFCLCMPLDPRAAELAAGRRLPAGKIMWLSRRKNAASRQPGRKKYAAMPPPNIRLKAALPRDFNEKLTITVQSSYDHAVSLQCCTKIGKSEKIILFRTQWAIDFYVELYFASTDK